MNQLGIDERPNILLRSFGQWTCYKQKLCNYCDERADLFNLSYREQLPHHNGCIMVHFPEIKWPWDVERHLVKWPFVSVYHCQWPHSLDKSMTLGFYCYRHGCTNRQCRIVNFQHPKNQVDEKKSNWKSTIFLHNLCFFFPAPDWCHGKIGEFSLYRVNATWALTLPSCWTVNILNAQKDIGTYKQQTRSYLEKIYFLHTWWVHIRLQNLFLIWPLTHTSIRCLLISFVSI